MKTHITPEDIEAAIKHESYHVIPGTTTTVCNLMLRNGFNVQGLSACADPNLYDKKKGEMYAREKAVDKIWPLEGYLLKQRMYEAALADAANSPEIPHV